MQYTLFIALVPLAAAVMVITLVYTWLRRGGPGAKALLFYLAASAGFLLTNTFELLGPTPERTLFWARFSYLFISALPVTWLAFALEYSGRRQWLKPERFWVFCVVPLLTLIFVLSNEQHRLVWESYTFRAGGPYLHLVVQHGPWFWVHGVYTYLALIIGSAVILGENLASRRVYRAQSLWIVAGTLTPLLFNLVYALRLVPGLVKDFSPIGYALAGIAFAFGISRSSLLNLAPVARNLLVDALPDGLLVLDQQRRVVDFNPAVREILDLPADDQSVVGRPVGAVWPESRAWLSGLEIPGVDPFGLTRPDVMRIRRGKQRRAFSLHIARLPRGWLVVLSDVSRRVDAEAALADANQALGDANARLRHLNEDLEARVANRTEELSLRAVELEAVARVSAALRKADGLDELLAVLLAETVAVTRSVGGAIILMENGILVVRAVLDLPGVSVGENLPPDAKPLGEALEAGVIRRLEKGQDCFAGQCQAVLAPLRTASRTVGLLYLANTGQAESAVEAERLLTAIAEMAGNALQRVRTMENLELLVQSRTRNLSTLYEVTAAANRSLDLSEQLQRMLEIILDALHLPAVALHLLDETGPAPVLRLAAASGLYDALPAPDDPAAPWQPVIARGGIVVLPALSDPVSAGERSLTACVSVPVRAKGQPMGALTVLGESVEHLSTEDIALLAAIGNQAWAAVETARLREQARRKSEDAAVLEERQRLARDLHDSVTQSLYSMVLFAEAGKDALDAANQERAAAHLARLRDTAQQALKETRLLIYQLRPLALQNEGLTGALRIRLDTVERRAGIYTELVTEIEAPVPEEVESGLYGIAQEALNNALKHSRAARITVRLACGPSGICLEIHDNGCGFDPAAPRSGGIGLSSMRERAQALGGSLLIQSEPGQGTTVLVTLDAPQEVTI